MIRLFNSLSQQKEPFEPRDPGKAGIYCCGPTVYNLVHIGNARPYVTFAVLRSWLAYRGLDVTLVTNITDVDDKIINKANAEGRDSAAVAEEYTAAYVEDTDRLNIPRPDVRAQGHRAHRRDHRPGLPADLRRPRLRGRRQRLLQGAQLRDYGKLSKQRIDELRGGRRVDARARQAPTRSTSPCGRPPSRASRPGTARGARAGRAGTSSARP